jgi:hypothetical protein
VDLVAETVTPRNASKIGLEEARMADGTRTYLEPSPDAAREFFSSPPAGRVVMLNLLRFRAIADYSAAPNLAPPSPISGEAAYRLYIGHTLPFLEKSGGKLLFYGKGGRFLIGPTDERWDAAMLVSQASAAAFLAFASNKEYLAGMGHRTAALDDSRLLPLVEAVVGTEVHDESGAPRGGFG